MGSANGRHRRPRQAPAIVVAAGVTGSAIAIPLLGASGAHAADSATWDRVAECESGGTWSADLGNGHYGGLQLTQETWSAYGGTEFAPRADLASRSQQISVAEKVLDDQGPKAWPSCAVISGLMTGGGLPGVDPGTSPSADPADDPAADPTGETGTDGTSGESGTSGETEGSDKKDGKDNKDERAPRGEGRQGGREHREPRPLGDAHRSAVLRGSRRRRPLHRPRRLGGRREPRERRQAPRRPRARGGGPGGRPARPRLTRLAR